LLSLFFSMAYLSYTNYLLDTNLSFAYNWYMRKRSPKYLLLWQRDWLKTRYEKDGLSTYQIAEVVGCSQFSVFNALVRMGIKRRKYTMSKSALLARQKGGFADKTKGEANVK
jgi:hypothetical protein